MSEISSVFRDYRRGKEAQYNTYTNRAHSGVQESFVGFIADVDANNRLTNRYNVLIPELQNSMLRNIPRNIPDAFSQANGVGKTSSPLRPGQPVVVRFLKSRSSLPFIDGSINLNGTDLDWVNNGIPGIDEQDLNSGLTLWRSAALPETLAAGGDAETTVWPIIPRSQSPNQGQNTGTSLEIPGNSQVVDYSGSVFTNRVGITITSGPAWFSEAEGTRGSFADQPIVNAVREASRVQAALVEEITYWRTMIGGSYQLVTPHPAGGRTTGGLTINPSNLNRFLEGNLTIPTGLIIPSLPGSKEAEGIISKVDETMGFIAEASKVAGGHLDFLQKKLGPIAKLAKDLLGSYEKFGNISLSISVPLPLNLQISLSVSFDFKTGKISISGAFGSGGPGAGTLIPTQALPLSSEGGFTAGGLPRVKRPTYTVKEEVIQITTTSIYTRYPQLSPPGRPAYVPVKDSTKIPYLIVSRDHNSLDFSTRPEEALASLLTKLGVTNAAYLIKYLVPLVNYGDIFSFLNIVSTLAVTPKDKVILSSASDILGGGSSGTISSIKEEIVKIEKPAVSECPPVPEEVYYLSKLIQTNDSVAAIDYLENFFFETMPDFNEWIENVDSVLNWVSQRNYPFYPAISELSKGNIYDFLALTVFISTGIDIEAYENVASTFRAYFEISFPLPTAGI